MNRHEFDRHVRLFAALDWLFKVATPIFCAVVLLVILFTTLFRG